MRTRLLLAVTLVLCAACAAGPARPGDGADASRSKQSVNTAIVPHALLTTFTSTYGPGTVVEVSTNGNVTGFASPTDLEHIGVGVVVEGYVVCYTNPNTSTPVTAYDVNSVAGGFGAATSTPSPTKVVRDTSDGIMRLTQTYTFDGKSRSLMITMTLENISGMTVKGVGMRRQVDFDVDAGGPDGTGDFNNRFGADTLSGFAYNDSGGGPSLAPGEHGMMIRGLSEKLGKLSGGGPGGVATDDIADVGCTPTADPTPNGPKDDGMATSNFPVLTMKPGAKFVMVLEYDAF
jgi:hypothetical protein